MWVEIEINPLDEEEQLRVQHVVGSFLYYTQVVNMTIIHVLNLIAADSSKPTERTIERVEQLLDYMHTTPNDGIRY